MCGIIGYIGYRRPQDVLMEGLTRLEYRGYDSAGLAWRENGRIERLRAVGTWTRCDWRWRRTHVPGRGRSARS